MRIRLLTFSGLIFLIAAVPFFWKVRPAEGQQQNFPQPNRKPACTCFCGDGTFNSFNIFPPGAAMAGKCYGGPLPAELCGNDLGSLPPGELQALCKRAKEKGQADCPALKRFCDGSTTPPGKGCENPATPWFGGASGCRDTQAPAVTIKGNSVDVSICGYPVFTRPNPIPGGDKVGLNAYLDAMKSHVQSQVGSKICCDKLREAARTGSPCNPATDIDCDGKPNSTDVLSDDEKYPDINLFTQASGAAVDRFPFGLDPDDPHFLPNSTAAESKDVGECPCKWELMKGSLTCSPDGRKDHVYAATWRCPANGKEVLTTKYAKASAPCKEFKNTAGAVSLFFNYIDLDPISRVADRSLCGIADGGL